MSDLWQRYQNIKAEMRILRVILKYAGRFSGCCLQINNVTGTIKCSRYELPEKEFFEKCKKCREEIEAFLKRCK